MWEWEWNGNGDVGMRGNGDAGEKAWEWREWAGMAGMGGNGDAGNKVTKSYSINCNPFSRAMVSPLSTENPTPGELISNRLASSLNDIPNSLTAQMRGHSLCQTASGQRLATHFLRASPAASTSFYIERRSQAPPLKEVHT